MAVTPRRFPPPWSVDDPDMKLGQSCHIVRDANGQALAYVYRLRDDPRTKLSWAVQREGATQNEFLCPPSHR